MTTSKRTPRYYKGTAIYALYGKYHLMSRPKGFDQYEVLLHQGSYEDPCCSTTPSLKEVEGAHEALDAEAVRFWRGTHAAGHASDIISGKAADAVASLPRPWLIEAHFKEPHEPFHYPARYEGLTGAPVFDASRGVWTLRGFDVAEPPTLMQRPTRCRGIDVFANRSLANATRRRTYAQLVADYLRTLKALDDGVGRVLRRVDDENARALHERPRIARRSRRGGRASTAATTSGLMLDEAIQLLRSFGIPPVLKPQTHGVLGALRRRRAHAPGLRRAALETRLRRRFLTVKALADKKGDDGEHFVLPLLRRGHEGAGDAAGPPSHVGIRTDRWKLILFDGLRVARARRSAAAQIFALYDLERDPRETTDVYASTSTKVVSKLKRELRAAMALYGGESHVKAGAHLPPDCLRSDWNVPLAPTDFGTDRTRASERRRARRRS